MNNNRRKTLAGLSPAQLNSRASLGPSRIVKDTKAPGKAVAMNGRPSLAPPRNPANNAPAARTAAGTGAQRRSSTFGSKSHGVRTDPRPLNDKMYQTKCVETLITYLSTHGYDHEISQKMLLTPMTKDFVNVAHFLMKQFDRSCRNFGKIEDDVPAFFKKIKYPFQISKTALVAVGSPHTWPTLLGALVWLAELLAYRERVDGAVADSFDEKSHAERDFFQYIEHAYRAFLEGDDDRCQELDDEKAREIEERMKNISERNKQLEEANGALQSQIEALQNEPSEYVAASEKKTELLSDRDKFHQLVEGRTAAKALQQRKLAEAEADLQSLQEQLVSVEQDNAEVKHRVASQTISREDVIKMNKDRIKQTEFLQTTIAARETLDQRVADLEIAVEQKLDDLEGSLQEYHATAEQLQLVPLTAKRSQGVRYEAHLNRCPSAASDFVDVDFKGGIKPALMRLRDATATRAQELLEEALALQERRDSGNDMLTERTEENALLGVQVRKLEKKIAVAKENMETAIAAVADEAERIKCDIAEMRNATSHNLAASDQQITQLQAQYEDTAATYAKTVETLNLNLSEALEELFRHKLHIQKRLETARDHVAQTYAQALEEDSTI
eukprot:jgi/Botrbrau1/14993/Bobra.0018s0093.1